MKIKHYADEWIQEWCQENGWTDLFRERYDNYWAFPPGAVMPEPIPNKVLRLIKSQKGLTIEERYWSISAIIGSAIAAFISFSLKCPLPIFFAFVYSAVTVAQLEIEEI